MRRNPIAWAITLLTLLAGCGGGGRPTDVPQVPQRDVVADEGHESADGSEDGICPGDYLISNVAEAEAIVDCTEITGDLEVTAPGVIDLALPNLETVGRSLSILGNDALASLLLPVLSTVGEDLSVIGNDALTSFAFPALGSVQGTLTVGRDTHCLVGTHALTSFHFPSLVTVGLHIIVEDNPELTSFDFPRLRSIGGILKVGEFCGVTNPALSSFSFSALETIGGYLSVHGNAALTSFDAPVLRSIGGSLLIRKTDSLDVFCLRSLETVGVYVEIVDNAVLAQCLVDALIAQLQASGGVGDDIWIHDNNETCTCDEVDGHPLATCP